MITTAADGLALVGSWSLAATPPGLAADPSDLDRLRLEWIPIPGAMTAAAALRSAGRWSLDETRDFDADDWWFHCEFSADPGQPVRLLLQGLATIADVWINGEHRLRSESMFERHAIDVPRPAARNLLLIRCASLKAAMATRGGRGRWRTALVSAQGLRHFRTSLLGHMPGWCPGVAPVGPWRPVLSQSLPRRFVRDVRLRTRLEGPDGRVTVAVQLEGCGARARASIAVAHSRADARDELRADGVLQIEATVRVPDVTRWWPHTHGSPTLYEVSLIVEDDADVETLILGRVGFRTISLDRGGDGRGFGLVVNDEPIFCRGVCWSPIDVVSLSATPEDYRRALGMIRDAGMNMVRIPGIMTYEDSRFHDLCDELGLLVWQDLMFANMDYPDDGLMRETITREVSQVLSDLHQRPSLAVVCGNSEVDQQAAMLGLPPGRRTSALFDMHVRSLVERHAPDAIWIPSTPGGGTLPFQSNEGVTHYYGVGAYRRPLEDARRASVRFAAECLAFANVPEPAMVERLVDGLSMPGSSQYWKARVPRDPGAGWDFEDVRDHYLEQLFGIDPASLRAADPWRYLALGRVATGEIMARTFAEWRRPGSSCRGALVWLAHDVWPGAGWGVIDAEGRPKAAYWYLRRVLAPVALLAIDEGLNGLWLHVVNDTADAIRTAIAVRLYRNGLMIAETRSAPFAVSARGHHTWHADALFDAFRDLTYAYRFGPPAHDALVAELEQATTGTLLSAAWVYPLGLPAAVNREVRLTAHVEGDQEPTLVLESSRLAHAVAIDVGVATPADNYVNVEPGRPRRIRLRRTGGRGPVRGSVTALNASAPVAIDQVAVTHVP
jgi:beta-mannosidase